MEHENDWGPYWNRVRRLRANLLIKYGPKYRPMCHQWYHADFITVFTAIGAIVITSVVHCRYSDVMVVSHYKRRKSSLTANRIPTVLNIQSGFTAKYRYLAVSGSFWWCNPLYKTSRNVKKGSLNLIWDLEKWSSMSTTLFVRDTATDITENSDEWFTTETITC